MKFTKVELMIHAIALVALLITLTVISILQGNSFSIKLLLMGIVYYIVCVLLYKWYLMWRSTHR